MEVLASILVPLLSAIAGGVIVVLGGYFLQQRSEERELLRAIRLVDAELHVVTVHLNLVIQFEARPDNLERHGEERFLPLNAWGEQQHVLAGNVSQELWERDRKSVV